MPLPLAEDTFTLKNRRMRKWFFIVLTAALVVVATYPPAFWLCGIGVPLVAIGSLANSARTNQWMSWQNEGSLNWVEGWAALTGAVLTALPLVAVLVRAWFT